ncbi:Hypothetical predicted protein [Lecanosticta acicola]|uniref:Uncharacterized protein n=1 Tax=Lecanosticta acicola TaxID=111012 RepID=A0AAI8YWI8_9PEZI|nr:Hypothetical predicted protein [Lecanosticta acicola]
MPPKESQTANTDISPHNSSTPLISSSQRQDLQRAGAPSENSIDEKDPKSAKRRFFGLGKKKEDKAAMDASSVAAGSVPEHSVGAAGTPSLKQQQHPELKANSQAIPISPSRLPHQAAAAASPSRLRSSSPRLNSPASSEIFERNVQEPVSIGSLGGERAESSPAHIPAHVITEDSIPPALEASAQAITSDELNPDDVEIVTSSTHQPASTVLEGSTSQADLTQLNSPASVPLAPLQHHKSEDSEAGVSLHQSGILSGSADDDGASNYGQLDPNDVRRLSFISFKDIVQSEHQHQAASILGEVGSRDSLHMANVPPGILQQENRAASPLRSPRSPVSTHSQSLSGGVVTPPLGVNATNPLNAASTTTNPEQSPSRSVGLGSPGLQHGELTIETMRQALRKTASGDLSNGRGVGMSPVSDENSVKEPPRSRTNT